MKFNFATCAAMPNGSDDDRHLVRELVSAGHFVEFKIWNDPAADWTRADRTLIRTTWDYQMHFEHFLRWIESTPNLMNSAEIVKANIDKRYLATTKSAVETRFASTETQLDDHLKQFGDHETLVLKPSVSASAQLTFKTKTRSEALERGREILAKRGDVLIQPFIESIATEGEVSLIYFGNVFSHAIVKRPAKGDYRVQQNFGGTVEPYNPSPKLLELAEEILPKTTYARVDLVDYTTDPKVGELELIEPELFFRTNANAAKAAVRALVSAL